MPWVILAALLIASPAVAQSRLGSVQESPFVSGSARIYSEKGDFVGTARENSFIPGRVDLLDSAGQSTGIELRENPFDPTQTDVFDMREPDDH